MVQRNSSLDVGYTSGDLSVYPEAKDNKETLYEVKNNAETNLKQTLTYNGKYIIVNDNSKFPDKGLVRVGPPPGKPGAAELIYYDRKTNGVFKNLIRGFAGSRQNPWSIGAWVTNAVMAEVHNATKDAIVQIEKNLGTRDTPTEESLNGILKFQEIRFLAPKPIFRAHRLDGPPPLKVRFQNFSTGPLVRFLWDFGDGTTSVEKNPIHTYQAEGIYSVQLNIITSLGAQGITSKKNYIEVSEEKKIPFFYVSPVEGYSEETQPGNGTEIVFVDQTDGDIIQRYWIFDGPGRVEVDGVWIPIDGNSFPQFDPNLHTAKYIYDKPGTYIPSLLILFENQILKRAFLKEEITVI